MSFSYESLGDQTIQDQPTRDFPLVKPEMSLHPMTPCLAKPFLLDKRVHAQSLLSSPSPIRADLGEHRSPGASALVLKKRPLARNLGIPPPGRLSFLRRQFDPRSHSARSCCTSRFLHHAGKQGHGILLLVKSLPLHHSPRRA